MSSLLYDPYGNRKYLTADERKAFLVAAAELPRHARLFCTLLAYTGARISELLALTPNRIDTTAGIVVIESLKKRQSGVFRAVPVPTHLIDELDQMTGGQQVNGSTLWGFGRTTAWKAVKQAMRSGGVTGLPATPKGLRHSFAVSALQSGVPINLVSRWLGHARIETTAIYGNAVGPEERAIAGRFWGSF